MRTVYLYMQISYDGYLTDKNNDLSWITNAEMDDDADLMQKWDSAIIGYTGYKEMAAYWPSAADDMTLSDTERKFAVHYNSIRKYVFSDKDHALEWNNSEIIRISDDVSIINAIAELKQQDGKDIVVYGGVQIAQTLTRLDLIDEYLLVTHPIILGDGRRLFEDKTQKRTLALHDVKKNTDGAVRLHYKRIK
jgi:dihydrofolate reductase